MVGLWSALESVTIYPSELARDRAVRLQPGEVAVTDGHLTLAELFGVLAGGHGRRLLSPEGQHLHIRRLMAGDDGWAEHALDPFAVRGVARTLSELRGAGLTAGHLASIDHAEAASWRRLLAAYEKLLIAVACTDGPETQRLAIEALIQGRIPRRFASVSQVKACAGVDLMGGALDLFAAWRVRGTRVQVAIPWDVERPHAFAWGEAIMHACETRGLPGIEFFYDDLVGDGPLAALRRTQWTDAAAGAAPVRMVRAGRHAHLAAGVADQVKAWLVDGVPPDDVVVGVFEADQADGIARELEGAGIGAYAGGQSLLNSAPARTLLEGLNCGTGRLDAARVVELMQRCGHWWQHGPAASLRQVLVAAKVRRLDDSSLARVRDLDARDHLTAIASALRAGLSEAAPEVQVDAAIGLFECLWPERPGPMPDAADPDAMQASTREHLHASSRIGAARQAVGETLSLLRAAARDAGGPPMRPEELHGLLQITLARQRSVDVGLRAGAVRVLPLAHLVGCRFRHVVVAAANTSPFAALSVERALSDSLRRAVNRRFGVRLVQWGECAERDALRGEASKQAVWLHALAAASEALAVFFVADEGDRGGPYVDELLRSIGLQAETLRAPHHLVRPPSVSHLLRHWAFAEGPCGHADAGLRQVLEHHVSVALANLRSRSLAGIPRPLGPDARSALQGLLLGAPQSVSKLEALGKCAFRFYAQVGLGLKKEDPLRLGASEREEGDLAHRLLHRVYAALTADGGLPAARRDIERTWQTAEIAFAAAWAERSATLTVHPSLAPALRQWAWRIIRIQLQRDLTTTCEPRWLEYSFSDLQGAVAEPLLLRSPDGQWVLRVRGSIDRIDAIDDGWLLMDYKRTPPTAVLERSYQLPLYALAARRLFGAEAPLALCWMGLDKDKPKMAAGAFEQPAFVARAEASLWERLDRVLGGDVHPDPLPETCERCDYRALCRIGEVTS